MPRKADFEQGQLAELLRRQHGVIGRDQALGCELTKKALAYRIRADGPWQRLLPGVYLAGTGTASAQQRDVAALLHAGPRSVLTGLAAVRRHSLRVGAPSVVTVLVPPGVRRQSTGFVQIQRTARMPAEFCVDGDVRFVLAARPPPPAPPAQTGQLRPRRTPRASGWSAGSGRILCSGVWPRAAPAR